MNLIPGNPPLPQPMQQWVDRVGGVRRVLLLAVGLGAAVLIFALSQWATAPSWVPLYSGLPLETTGRVTERLNEAGIRHRLELGGSEVRVPAGDVARARVLLAAEGLPSAGRPGLELFDQPSWGMTDFTQRINYRRALEGELERTISKMRGVESAKVHLAMYETASFRRVDRPAEASVVIQLRSGIAAGPEVVQGIAHLVASSVDGLRSDNVTVLDGTGRLLSMPNEPGSLAALNSRQLAVQREMEVYLEAKAEEIVSRIVGPGNARIQVAANVNFDRVERKVETVDPDRQALLAEQRAEIVPGPEGGAGSTNQSTTFENSRSLETFSGATGTLRRLSVAVLVNDRQVADESGARSEPRSAEELARIESLVRSAVGVDESRGDAISVVSIPFDVIADPMAVGGGTDLWSIVAYLQRPVITIIGLLLAFFVALRVIRSLRIEPAAIPARGSSESLPVARPAGTPALAGSAAGATQGAAFISEIDPALSEPLLPHSSALRDRVAVNVSEYPDLAARLVRAWLKEG
jgi:flagellar M-ring protein FliF